MYRVWNYVTTYSLLMVIGAVIALIWANIDASSYRNFVELELIDDFSVGHAHYDASGVVASRSLTVHYLVNDVLI